MTAATSAEQLRDRALQDLAAAEQELRGVQAEEAKHAANPPAYDVWRTRRDHAETEVARCRLVVAQREEDVRSETVAAWRKDKAAQGKLNDALTKRMRAEGPALLEAFLNWVGEIAAAEAATARINAHVPPGEEHLRGPDALARAAEMQPEKILREVEIELWVHDESGQIVLDQRAVVAISKAEGTVGAWRTPCARRRFKEVTYLPEVAVQRATPFLQALRLPYFDGRGLVFDGDRDAATAQQVLSTRSANAPKPPERQRQTRFDAVGPWQPVRSLLLGPTGRRGGGEQETTPTRTDRTDDQ